MAKVTVLGAKRHANRKRAAFRLLRQRARNNALRKALVPRRRSTRRTGG